MALLRYVSLSLCFQAAVIFYTVSYLAAAPNGEEYINSIENLAPLILTS